MRKLLFTLVLVFSLAATSNAETIVLVADAWPPYNNPADDPQQGYIVDIARAIFAKHGHEVDYQLIPWKVAVEETRKGTYDGLIGADQEDGAGLIFPKRHVGSYQVAFFVRKGNPWRFTNTKSLNRVKLGVAEGYGYNPWLFDYIQANKKDLNRIQSVSGDHPLETNIKKLLAGRIDVVASSVATMNYTAKQMGVSEQIQLAGSGGPGRKVYLVFTPGKKTSSSYATLFDQGLKELRSSKELQKILARYGMTDWE